MKWLKILIFFILVLKNCAIDKYFYKNKVKEMFIHAYDSYVKHAYPLDELKPLSCSGMNTWGNFSLTLIDALDVLAIMGNRTEFLRAQELIVKNLNFNMDINVSVFETNIRIVGGLLGAHFMSALLNLSEIGYPCKGPLLDMAVKVANKLIPAFNTKTGMPYGTVNLKYGVPVNETPITCTAATNTFALEWFTLSALTGDPIYKHLALKSLGAIWKNHRSQMGLVGNHINTHTGDWIGKEAGIGSGVDSYFEYLVKGAFLSRDPTLIKMFLDYENIINDQIRYNGWYFWVHMYSGSLIWPIFQSLEAFWPGLLVSMGKLDEAQKSFRLYHSVWLKYGSLPETFNVVNDEYEKGHASYPLRPEFIESAYHLYQATGDPYYLEVGVDVITALENLCRTSCGYAVLKDVFTKEKSDRMESFFLAETLKYLYLLFSTDPSFTDEKALIFENDISQFRATHFITQTNDLIDLDKIRDTNASLTENYDEPGKCVVLSGGYLFNTEAHPIHISAVDCCGVLNQGPMGQTLDQYSTENKIPYSIDNTMDKKTSSKDLNDDPNKLYLDAIANPINITDFVSLRYEDNDEMSNLTDNDSLLISQEELFDYMATFDKYVQPINEHDQDIIPLEALNPNFDITSPTKDNGLDMIHLLQILNGDYTSLQGDPAYDYQTEYLKQPSLYDDKPYTHYYDQDVFDQEIENSIPNIPITKEPATKGLSLDTLIPKNFLQNALLSSLDILGSFNQSIWNSLLSETILQTPTTNSGLSNDSKISIIINDPSGAQEAEELQTKIEIDKLTDNKIMANLCEDPGSINHVLDDIVGKQNDCINPHLALMKSGDVYEENVAKDDDTIKKRQTFFTRCLFLCSLYSCPYYIYVPFSSHLTSDFIFTSTKKPLYLDFKKMIVKSNMPSNEISLENTNMNFDNSAINQKIDSLLTPANKGIILSHLNAKSIDDGSNRKTPLNEKKSTSVVSKQPSAIKIKLPLHKRETIQKFEQRNMLCSAE